jgi:hypothetical protein
MPPIRLTDDELDAVMTAAIAVERRYAFLQQVAAELRNCEIGPGLVHRIVAQVQREFFDPPLESGLVLGSIGSSERSDFSLLEACSRAKRASSPRNLLHQRDPLKAGGSSASSSATFPSSRMAAARAMSSVNAITLLVGCAIASNPHPVVRNQRQRSGQDISRHLRVVPNWSIASWITSAVTSVRRTTGVTTFDGNAT